MTNPHPQTTKPALEPSARRWLLGILGVLALLGAGAVACTTLVGPGVNHAAQKHNAEEKAQVQQNKTSCAGVSYPHQQPTHDQCAAVRGGVTLTGVQVAATPLRRSKTELCTTVAYMNSGSKTVTFTAADWRLQTPTGSVKNALDASRRVITKTALRSGDLVAGRTKSGTICYNATGRGQFVLIYTPHFLTDARGIWITKL